MPAPSQDSESAPRNISRAKSGSPAATRTTRSRPSFGEVRAARRSKTASRPTGERLHKDNSPVCVRPFPFSCQTCSNFIYQTEQTNFNKCGIFLFVSTHLRSLQDCIQPQSEEVVKTSVPHKSSTRETVISIVAQQLGIPEAQVTDDLSLGDHSEDVATMVVCHTGKMVCLSKFPVTVADLLQQIGA